MEEDLKSKGLGKVYVQRTLKTKSEDRAAKASEPKVEVPTTSDTNAEALKQFAEKFFKTDAGKPEPKENISEGSTNQRMYPKYFKSVVNDTHIDVYRVHQLFNLNNEMLCHASKKLLLAGERTGEKSLRKDVIEARDTLNRYLELNP